jgi:hypothetical protein
MDHYSFTLRPPPSDTTAASFTSTFPTIKHGCYRAVFSMLGSDLAPGYIAVQWAGLVNNHDSREDGTVIACIFGDSSIQCFKGTLYLANPDAHVQITFFNQDGSKQTTTEKQTVSIDLQRLC